MKNKSKIQQHYLFIVIIIFKIFGTAGFVPEGRAGHVTLIVGDQIYFMGGSRFIMSTNPIKSSIRVYNLSDEVFVLNLSSQFSTSNPPYIDLSNTARMKYGSEKGSAVLGGTSKQDVYLIGGVQQDLAQLNKIDNNITITSNQTFMLEELNKTYNMTDQFIFYYRPYSNYWSYPQSPKGTSPTRRRSTSTIIDQKGIIYIFGGRAQVDTGSPTFICYNDLYTFDTILLSWNKVNAPNAPSPRSHAASVLLPNGKILYIGGVTQTEPGKDADLVDMNEIAIFDTNSSTWSYKNASSSTPIQPRLAHTATLTPDNNEIIIIGGNSNYQLNLTTSKPVFVVLNIATEPYQYSELITSGDKPPPLAVHTVNLYQNYIIVAFGNITNDMTQPVEINSNIYLLDVPCKIWVPTFIPGKSVCESSHGTPSWIIPVFFTVGFLSAFVLMALLILIIYYRLIRIKVNNLGWFVIYEHDSINPNVRKNRRASSFIDVINN